MKRITKFLNLSYVQEKKLQTMLTIYFTTAVNIISIFLIIYLIIILVGICKYLKAFTIF